MDNTVHNDINRLENILFCSYWQTTIQTILQLMAHSILKYLKSYNRKKVLLKLLKEWTPNKRKKSIGFSMPVPNGISIVIPETIENYFHHTRLVSHPEMSEL